MSKSNQEIVKTETERIIRECKAVGFDRQKTELILKIFSLPLTLEAKDKDYHRGLQEGILSLKRIQANLPLTDPILQNRNKMDYEIQRLTKLLRNK